MLEWFFGWIFTLMWIDYTFFKGEALLLAGKLTIGLVGLVTAAWWMKKEAKEEAKKEAEYQEFLRQKEITEAYYNTLQKLKEQN